MTPAHQAIAAAKAAFLLIWPDGATCGHEHARAGFEALDAAEKQATELRDALESMCHQYLRVSDGKLYHDFMSAGEAAFDALDWSDAGHPVDAQALCEVPGCGQSWSCGVFGNDDKYHCLCGTHYTEFKKDGRMETTDQAMARHAKDLRGMNYDQPGCVRLLRERWSLTAEQAAALWDQAAKAPAVDVPTSDTENQIGG